jgi:ATP-binding cassette subfamily B protein
LGYLEQSAISIERIAEFVHLEGEDGEKHGQIRKKTPIGLNPSSRGIESACAVSIQGLGLRYSDSEDLPWALRNFSLDIPAGSKVAIVGRTGSGKSTLLDIIMGLIFPSNGKIYIDKSQLSKKNILNWRACIAHVPQHVYITDASVAENIAFGVHSSCIDLERVKLAAKKAQIAQTIEEWDDGYQTIVGERGARLSGGQRQRIGIARALYKEAQVIIFDEATSALDDATESAIMNTLYNLDSNLTIIMVAHRLSTLESCDYIVQLENGVVKNILNYKELKNKISEEK